MDTLSPEPDVRPLFIVGSGRCGSGMLRRVFNEFTPISIPPESCFLVEYMEAASRYGDLGDDDNLRRLLRDIVREFAAAGPSDEVVLRRSDMERIMSAVSKRTYAGVVCAVYDDFKRRHDKDRWGDKTPHYVERIGDILRLFPGARFVHLIRDGRDAALSVMRRPWGAKNAYRAALWWRRRVSAGLSQGRGMPPDQYLEVRYEDIVAAPERELRKLFSFAAAPFDPRVLGFPFRSDGVGKWRKEMPPRDVLTFERIAGDLLGELGYERAFKAEALRPIGRLESLYAETENRLLGREKAVWELRKRLRRWVHVSGLADWISGGG